MGGVAWYYENLVNKAGTGRDLSVQVLKLGTWALKVLWPFLIIPLLLTTIKLKTTHWWVGQVLPVGTVVWLLSFVWKKPYIVSTHGMDVLLPLKSPRKRWLVRKILKRASLITANSEWTKQKIIEHYFPQPEVQSQKSKIVVVYPEPKPKREVLVHEVRLLKTHLHIPEGAKMLLTVARLVARKGIDRVLAALPETWQRAPMLHYVVVGEGEVRDMLMAMHSTLSGNGKVHFVGRVSDDELATYYTAADAFIQLPRDIEGDAEGFGIVYLEANQYRLPIIATTSGGTGEALEMCNNVLIVQHGDEAHEVAQAICHQFKT